VLGRHRDLDGLRDELGRVEALIAAHPLASPRIRAAHELIERSRERNPHAVDRELAERGLPDATALGRAQVSGSWSWWRLHRRRRQLVRRIRRLGGV
jgi:hypothetical protein